MPRHSWHMPLRSPFLISPWDQELPLENQLHVSQGPSGTRDPNRVIRFAKWSENYSEHLCPFRIIYSEVGHLLQHLKPLNQPMSLFHLWGTFGLSHQKQTSSTASSEYFGPASKIPSCRDFSLSQNRLHYRSPYITIHETHRPMGYSAPNRSGLFAKWSEKYSKHFCLFRTFYSAIALPLHRPRHPNHSMNLFILWGTFGSSQQNKTCP